MSLKVIFLGTAGSIPTPKRSLPAIAVVRKGELILFDCGEGVQRQMLKAGLGFNKKMKVFISHMHGDHVLGLPGLMQTMSLLHRSRKLELFGPSDLRDFVEITGEVLRSPPTFPLEITEVGDDGLVCEEKEYSVFSAPAEHLTPSFSYSLVEKQRYGKFHPDKAEALGIPEGVLWSRLQQGLTVKLQNGRVISPETVVGPLRLGRKIVYTGDTKHSVTLVELAKNADILIHECTFDNEFEERANEDGHSTPKQAAISAAKANVKRLILTHISARYKTPELLLTQARKTFANVDVAEDFMEIQLPLHRVKQRVPEA